MSSTAQTALVTGANGGVGRHIAAGLAERGFRVLIAARHPERGEAARAWIEAEAKGRGQVELLLADFSKLEDVRALAAAVQARVDRLEVLVNNAGLMLSERRETEDGHEMTLQVNHLAPYLLTRALLPLLERSAPARIINVSSDAHPLGGPLNFDDLQSTKRFVGLQVYARSKLCNILFTKELDRRFKERGVYASAVHPGLANSDFAKHGDTKGGLGALMGALSPFKISLAKAAQTPLWLCTEPSPEERSGGYFFRRRRWPSVLFGRGEDDAARLWEVSEKLVGLSP